MKSTRKATGPTQSPPTSIPNATTTAATHPQSQSGPNDLSPADGTLYGYGWVNAFNPPIAEQLRPAALESGLDWSESEHGALLTLSRVDPDHQELQRALDVVRPLLRPLEEEVDFNAAKTLHTFAT